MRVFTANIRMPNGSLQKVEVRADNPFNAKAMLESQYGKDKVTNLMQKG